MKWQTEYNTWAVWHVVVKNQDWQTAAMEWLVWTHVFQVIQEWMQLLFAQVPYTLLKIICFQKVCVYSNTVCEFIRWYYVTLSPVTDEDCPGTVSPLPSINYSSTTSTPSLHPPDQSNVLLIPLPITSVAIAVVAITSGVCVIVQLMLKRYQKKKRQQEDTFQRLHGYRNFPKCFVFIKITLHTDKVQNTSYTPLGIIMHEKCGSPPHLRPCKFCWTTQHLLV